MPNITFNYNLLRYEFSTNYSNSYYRTIFRKYYTQEDTNQEQLRQIYKWFSSLVPHKLMNIGLKLYTIDDEETILRTLEYENILSQVIYNDTELAYYSLRWID